MSVDFLPKVVLTGLGLGVSGYLALGLYSQSCAEYRQIEPVRTLLRDALAGDSAALAEQAGEQPIRWVSAAIRVDSAAVREWAESRPRRSKESCG